MVSDTNMYATLNTTNGAIHSFPLDRIKSTHDLWHRFPNYKIARHILTVKLVSGMQGKRQMTWHTKKTKTWRGKRKNHRNDEAPKRFGKKWYTSRDSSLEGQNKRRSKTQKGAGETLKSGRWMWSDGWTDARGRNEMNPNGIEERGDGWMNVPGLYPTFGSISHAVGPNSGVLLGYL